RWREGSRCLRTARPGEGSRRPGCVKTSRGTRRLGATSAVMRGAQPVAGAVDAPASDLDGRATVAKLNVDENPNVPGRFAVRGIPTLLLFKEGQLAETIVGLRAKED